MTIKRLIIKRLIIKRFRAAVLALLGAGGGAMTVYALEDLPLVNTETLSLEGVESLTLSYGHDDLVLRESESGDLVIKEYMNRDNSRYFARVSRAGGAVRIRQGRRPWLHWNWKARAEIYLPRSFRGDLRIANASGTLAADADLLGYRTVDITVSSGEVFLKEVSGETVSIHISSGEMELRALRGNSFISVSSGRLRLDQVTGGETHIKVSSGRLRIGALEGQAAFELTSGNVVVDRARGGMEGRVSSGILELRDFSGPGSFRVSSGNLRMNLGELREDLRFRLSSGTIDLGIPLDIPFNLDAETSSGSVQVDEGGLEVLRVSGNVLRPLGAGAERTIFARVSSGKLVINRR
jgi:hypothetical protein